MDDNLGAMCLSPNPYFSTMLLVVGNRALDYVGHWSDRAGSPVLLAFSHRVESEEKS